MSRVKYNNTRFRVVMSFVASLYILLHGHNLGVIVRAFSTPSFYIALGISFLITLFLVYLVHKITVWLDKRHDWRTHFWERILWQAIFAVLVPVLIDLGLISIYSAFIGENFIQRRFLLVDFPIIVSFIVLFNMYYVIRYLLLTESIKNEPKKHKPFKVDYNGTFAEIDPELEIVCFFRSGNLIKVLTQGRTFETRGYSITDLENEFKERGFMKISRSTIINLKFVQGYATAKRDTIKVLFHPTIEVFGIDEDVLLVKEKQVQIFKDQFNSSEA